MNLKDMCLAIIKYLKKILALGVFWVLIKILTKIIQLLHKLKTKLKNIFDKLNKEGS